MKRRKVTLTLTAAELAELINCVDAAARYGLAYGQESLGTGGGTLQLSINYRQRLLAKLEATLAEMENPQCLS